MENAPKTYWPANTFEAFGVMACIAMDSGYVDMTLGEASLYLVPPLTVSQFKIYINDRGEPDAFVTWALVDDACHEAMLADGRNPPPNCWHSGPHLWFIDIVAPHRNTRQIIRDLQRNHFPDRHAHSIKRNPDGSVKRVKVWRNALVGQRMS